MLNIGTYPLFHRALGDASTKPLQALEDLIPHNSGEACRNLPVHGFDGLLYLHGDLLKEWRGAAGAGLLASYQLKDFESRLWKKEDLSGTESLSHAQRHYRAVMDLDAEVKNGGLAQYFFNSSGDQWREAQEGLQAMGSAQRLVILTEAIGLFGKDGPSPDREVRQEQLSKLYEKNDNLFDELDSRYFKSPELLIPLSTRFVLSNANDFR